MYFKGTKELIQNMASHMSLEGQDEFNLEDVSYTLIRKCNYIDTIPVTVLNNLLMNGYKKLSDFGVAKSVLRPLFAIVWLLDWWGAVGSLMSYAYSIERSMERFDNYTFGKLTGSIFKFLLQLKMKGHLPKLKL
jgi:hypothetical protein